MPDSVRSSTWEKVLNFLAASEESTPYLLVDRDVVAEKASVIGRGIRNCRVYYALKANPDIGIARLLDRPGMNFEIASEGELRILASLGIGPGRIISSNPVKSPGFIKQAVSYGIEYFAFDSAAEVDKLSALAPGCNVYVRLTVPNEGSEWPLSKKFGIEPDAAVELLLYARDRGLNPVGVTFHVGSQCTNIYNWSMALDKVSTVWSGAEDAGLRLDILNIGGGYPIRYTKDVIDIQSIEEMIDALVSRKFPPDVQVHLEPGRAVVGDAGVFVTSVIGKADRGGVNWLYIDVGVFNGLMESIGGIKYEYIVGSRAGVKRWTIAGPSCDSFDVIAHDVELPEPMIGDHLLIPSSGAYTISYASEFNGFPIPKTILI
ncbi:MAG: type III PLP-dependent enzyme [Nitrospirae bacterium]|nr:type III PLP-dependent enzyme [Nitrospirota bacterium]